MGKLTKHSKVQNTVRPELAEALEDLMSMGINIKATSLLRDINNPLYTETYYVEVLDEKNSKRDRW